MESITEKITDNIVSSLEAMSTDNDYDFTPGAVEQERSVQIIGDRYPFIEVAGPEGVVEPMKDTECDEHTLSYVITFVDKLNDTNYATDKPLTKQAASVVCNIHKALMADYTRGGYAIMTWLRGYGYTNYTADTGEHFEVYVLIEVQAHIDSFDMTLTH